jgi:hypothetical protein
MSFFKLDRTGPIWGLAGFVLGVALTGTAIGALGNSASTSLPGQSLVRNADTSIVLSQRIIASRVKDDEFEMAINEFPIAIQRKFRTDVASGKYRLLWLTAWDWDTAEGEIGNTISILTNDYRRFITLTERRTRIAIPEPQSGIIEMRGEVSEDGNISISVLSGTQPIALPTMAPGQTVKLHIDAVEPVAVSANGHTTSSFHAAPPADY